MKISEIFLSIDGEGIRTGYPVIFIRSFRCSIRCSYCDSLYAVEGNEYVDMSVSDIVHHIQTKYNWCKRITFTGGEPLIQPDAIQLIKILLELGYEVNIETNGAVDLSHLLSDSLITMLRDKLIITMDWKSISSNMSDKMITDNVSLLKPQDVLKFVVSNESDLYQMKSLLKVQEPDCNVFVSPVFGMIEAADIVKYLIGNQLKDVRVQLQIHKYIYPVDMRGV